MTSTCQELLALLRRDTLLIETREPEGYRQLRTGQLEHRPGCDGAYFAALDIAHGMLRDFAMYIVYPALVLHRERRDIESSRALVREMFPVPLNYLGYSGFVDLKRNGHRFLDAAPMLDADEFDEALAALLRYVNLMYAWAYHEFPWNIGDHMRYAPADVPAITSTAVDRLTPTDTRIRLRWDPLGIEVRAFLAVDLNTQLCADLLAALPFTCLQSHPMVSGESIFAWTPLTTTAPTPYKEEIRSAPVGRMRFSTRTGQKLIVQYGMTTEDIFAPVIGSVLEEDRHLLPIVGKAVWESTYASKVPMWLTVTRDVPAPAHVSA